MKKQIHKHHIIPKHIGGSDDADNLIELSVEEHADAHRKLYEEYGRREDYIAWKCLAGIIGKEELVAELMRLGSIKGGEINRLSGHMSRVGSSISSELRKEIVAKAVATMREKKLGCFFDPDLHRIVARLGGLAQGRQNAKTDHLKKISNDYWHDVYSGKKSRNIKKIWITNEREEYQISRLEPIPDGFRKGRYKRTKWINNGIHCTRIGEFDIVPDGYQYGRIKGWRWRR